jgi:hypothetical protein
MIIRPPPDATDGIKFDFSILLNIKWSQSYDFKIYNYSGSVVADLNVFLK